MARPVYSALILALMTGMLVSGVANTLLTKLQDNAGFEQPVWQTLNMFIGESGCWLVVFAHFFRMYCSKSNNNNNTTEYEPVTTEEEEEDVPPIERGAREGNGLHSHGEGVYGSSVAVAGEEEDDTSPLVKTLSQQP